MAQAVAFGDDQRVECPLSDIVLGLKCGSSDTTSGLAANPALGMAVERLVQEGGSAIGGRFKMDAGVSVYICENSRP